MREISEQEYTSNVRDISDYLNSSETGLDIIGWAVALLERWKLISILTILPLVLLVLWVLSIPRVYMSTVELSKPTLFEFIKLNRNSSLEATPELLIGKVYDKVRSHDYLKLFLRETGYLKKLYPEANLDTDFDRVFNKFIAGVDVEFLEPDIGGSWIQGTFVPGAKPPSPTKFKITALSTNEEVMSALLNDLVSYTNEYVVSEIKLEQQVILDSEKDSIEKQISFLRSDAENTRLLNVEKLKGENAALAQQLRQKKELLIAKQKNDHDVDVNVKTEANVLELAQLRQERELIINKASAIRSTQIAEAEKALILASSLGIELPANIGLLKTTGQSEGLPSTYINLSNEQELPLYMKGTRYLKTYIETLKNINNDELYLPELADIDKNISKLVNDVELAHLRERNDHSLYMTTLSEIESEIFRLENDSDIRLMEQRTNDDPFIIEDLIPLQSRLSEIASYSLDFDGVKTVSVSQSAIVGTFPVKPNRKLIVLMGGIVFLVIAVLIAIFMISIQNQKNKNDER